jgi:hypothetical protein
MFTGGDFEHYYNRLIIIIIIPNDDAYPRKYILIYFIFLSVLFSNSPAGQLRRSWRRNAYPLVDLEPVVVVVVVVVVVTRYNRVDEIITSFVLLLLLCFLRRSFFSSPTPLHAVMPCDSVVRIVRVYYAT